MVTVYGLTEDGWMPFWSVDEEGTRVVIHEKEQQYIADDLTPSQALEVAESLEVDRSHYMRVERDQVE